jgi:hypothetical protein
MKFCHKNGSKTSQIAARQYDMSMSLTKQDLQAVKQVVEDTIDKRVPELVQSMLDNLENNLAHKHNDLEASLVRAFSAIQQVLDKVKNDLKADFKEVKEDIEVMKFDTRALKVSVRHIEVRGTLKT